MSHYHTSTSELGDMATMAVSPTSGERQDSCSFRTRLDDDGPRFESDDITYYQPVTLFGRTIPGNPHISPSDMLFPTTPTTENTITPGRLTPVSESNDPMNFSFITLEEFPDTEMVHALNENNAALNNKNTALNNSRKRKSSFSTAASPPSQKRVAKFAFTPRTPRLSPQQCQGAGGMENGDISDDWSLITEAEMARIPVPRQSSLVVMKQSLQAYLLRRAMSKARSARRKVRTMERSCWAMFLNPFDQHGYAGPTRCISVGSSW